MYKVSVITPFHNVDMGMFAKCADSMRRQTIGFENVQWVIVAHNCQPHCLPLLTEMFAGDGNVVIRELNDGRHSPAPPRNYGLQFVTGPYVGFLDGDDSDLFETFPSGAFHEYLPLKDHPCRYAARHGNLHRRTLPAGRHQQCRSLSLCHRPRRLHQGDADGPHTLYNILNNNNNYRYIRLWFTSTIS